VIYNRPVRVCCGVVSFINNQQVDFRHGIDIVGRKQGLHHGKGNLTAPIFSFEIGDIFILVSDGVNNWLNEEKINSAIQSKHLNFSRTLCSIAKKSGSNDDLSAVVIKTKSLEPYQI